MTLVYCEHAKRAERKLLRKPKEENVLCSRPRRTLVGGSTGRLTVPVNQSITEKKRYIPIIVFLSASVCVSPVEWKRQCHHLFVYLHYT